MLSYPGYYSHVVAKFVNAPTLDGYNPYRISSEGVDWEVPEPDDPWGNIGYWGDHQVVIFSVSSKGGRGSTRRSTDVAGSAGLRLRRCSVPNQRPTRHDPNPRSTITFVDERAAAITRREAAIGPTGGSSWTSP